MNLFEIKCNILGINTVLHTRNALLRNLQKSYIIYIYIKNLEKQN